MTLSLPQAKEGTLREGAMEKAAVSESVIDEGELLERGLSEFAKRPGCPAEETVSREVDYGQTRRTSRPEEDGILSEAGPIYLAGSSSRTGICAGSQPSQTHRSPMLSNNKMIINLL